jgi:uncharacterized protein with HEPN domain
MSRSTLDYLKHIRDEAEFLATKTAGLSKEEFLQEAVLQRAFTRSLEIVGEAVKNLNDDFGTVTSISTGNQLLVCAIDSRMRTSRWTTI